MKANVVELRLKDYLNGNPQEQERFEKLLFSGLKDCGFIIIKDHPIHSELLNTAYKASQKFFNLPADKKRKYLNPGGGGQRGYTAFGTEHAKGEVVPDLKEFWHVGRNLPEDHELTKIYPENVWPSEEVPEFESIFSEVYSSLEKVGQILLQALTPSLNLEKDYFNKLNTDGNSILRLLHYPPIPEGSNPRAIRAAAHEDINLITLLVSASASGLELLDRQGQWLAIETDPENLIVDSGDMLSRITNNLIPSTTHRVVNPKGANTSRYSMPFFIHPHPQSVLSCLPQCKTPNAPADITANEFLMERLREIGLT